jgi:hypothetical protein
MNSSKKMNKSNLVSLFTQKRQQSKIKNTTRELTSKKIESSKKSSKSPRSSVKQAHRKTRASNNKTRAEQIYLKASKKSRWSIE